MNTTENELIAEFMGWETKQTNYGKVWRFLDGEVYAAYELDFNKSWNWLMPVVEKINSLPKTAVSIYPHHCIISVDGTAESGSINHGETMPLIQIVYPAVVKFIKWYNEQNEKL